MFSAFWFKRGPTACRRVPSQRRSIWRRIRSPSILTGLRLAGLVTVRREGRSMIYAARFETMNALLAFLTENCCGGAPEKCKPVAACKPTRAKAPTA